MRIAPVLVVALWSTGAHAHDVSVDVGALFTSTSANNPRTGSVAAGASGTVDVSDAVSLFVGARYTRDLATRTATSASPGSDVFLFDLGVGVAPDDHWLVMLDAVGSPPSTQRSATEVSLLGGATTDVVVNSRTWNLGGLLLASWARNGGGDAEPTLDAAVGVNHFQVDQRLVVGTDARAQALRASCETAAGRRTTVCALLAGVSSPLTQVRLGLGGTATLFHHTDLGLELSYYLYDRDPSDVGYFSLVALGRAQVGAGVPVLPLQLSVRPSYTRRFDRRFSLRLAYQLGLYLHGEGTNHALTARFTWRVTSSWRLWVAGTGQLDATDGTVTNPGGNALAGVLVEF